MRLLTTRIQLLSFCWLLQILLLSSRYEVVQGQGIQRCARDRQCANGYECSNEACIARNCIERELAALGRQIDPREYKEQILREADLTEAKLEELRMELGDDDKFSRSHQVRDLMDIVQGHSYELSMIGEIVRSCQDGTAASITAEARERNDSESADDANEIGRVSIGNYVGNLFKSAWGGLGDLFQENTTPSPSSAPSGTPSVSAKPSTSPSVGPSMTPSISAAPSEVPSVSPTIAPVLQRTYVGIHMEGGVFFDYSFSLFSESSNNTGSNAGDYNFKRGCFGAEIGMGFEVSLIVIITSNQYATDIVGGSFVLDDDIALGGAFGLAVGGALTGEAFGSDCPFFLEVTLGGGLGFGLGLGALCRTGFVIP